ncbi:phospholipid-transporting ATPase ABCA3-like [Dermacentor silvarum]|uniref:phospholipid-transporting ATPase ABCA3-like n=1 Tax=Dermacentor silvarum TaxID=543639 RepID=UPI0021009204|nr:phospholipid-transporting ATPase ABCA3-like [Dermacentor silvarum]
MARGQLVCLASVPRLRKKYGRGCTIAIKAQDAVPLETEQKIDDLLKRAFGAIKLDGQPKGVIMYGIREQQPWSALFGELRSVHKLFEPEYVLVSEIRLDRTLLHPKRSRRRAKPGGSAVSSSSSYSSSPEMTSSKSTRTNASSV